MAVGYLASSNWDPKYLLTKNRGREFKGAVYDMGGVGLGFWNESVFIFFDVDNDDAMYDADEMLDMLKALEAGEYGFNTIDGFESDELSVLYRFGSFDEEVLTNLDLSDEQREVLEDLVADLKKVYWD